MWALNRDTLTHCKLGRASRPARSTEARSLNDSQRAIGTGPDAHAALAGGRIWSRYRGAAARSGIAAVADCAQRHGTTVILERKPREALLGDYRILRELGVGASAPPSEDPRA
jgi:hypothetical protein